MRIWREVPRFAGSTAHDIRGARQASPFSVRHHSVNPQQEEVPMKDLSDIVSAAVGALVSGDRDRYQTHFEWACELYDEEDVRVAFVERLCRRAGQARRDAVSQSPHGEFHGLVSRLKDAAYKLEPESLNRDDIRRILRREGAVGYRPPQRRQGPRTSMLATVNG